MLRSVLHKRRVQILFCQVCLFIIHENALRWNRSLCPHLAICSKRSAPAGTSASRRWPPRSACIATPSACGSAKNLCRPVKATHLLLGFHLMSFPRKGRISFGAHLLVSAIQDGIRDSQFLGDHDAAIAAGFQEPHCLLFEFRRESSIWLLHDTWLVAYHPTPLNQVKISSPMLRYIRMPKKRLIMIRA